jgi:nitroimidazol reductase NimA-like FMN-containing flavoprotein (pyridoxamine 5'-phosphate oxidase superfamily)
MSAAADTTILVELTREECLTLLAGAVIGRVVVPMGTTGRPVVRPVNYTFDTVSQSVVFRSAPGGKLHALLGAAQACFEVDAFDLSNRTGWSVIIQGVTEPVTDSMEVRRLERLTPPSWVTGTDGQLIRIRARTVTGRRIEAGRAG